MTTTKRLTVLALILVVGLLMVGSAAANLRFPPAYKAGLNKLVEIMHDRNLTWSSGVAIFNRDLEKVRLSGQGPNGASLTNLNLFRERVLYVIERQQYCQREPLYGHYSDPLDVARYTSYAGLVEYQGRRVQQWSYSSGNVAISIYVTNDPQQNPVRLYFLQARSGLLVEYASFTAGSSSSDFEPPSSCSRDHGRLPLAAGARNPFQPIADFIAGNSLLR